MANETQYYKFPFAENGNREDVPDESISGNVSFETGYGPDYELAQGDPNRKRIPRTAYNEVLNGVTKNIKQWQENTFPTWVEDNGDGVALTYSKGPIVSHDGEIWVSLEGGNDDEPTSASDKWLLFDPSLFDIDPIFENYLKPNQNLNVPYGNAVLPNAVAEDYTAGDVFAYDYEAVTDIVGLTRTGGITSGTSGTYMRSYEGDFSSSFFGVQLADGTASQTGVDIDYNVRKSGYTTVAVDIAVAPDHYCAVLAPASGKVSVINDKDSWNSAIHGVMITNSGYTPTADDLTDIREDSNLLPTITFDQRIVLTNPFGVNAHCDVVVECLINSIWTQADGNNVSEARYGYRGGSVAGEGIVIQTGQNGLSLGYNINLTTSGTTAQTAAAPCRVIVTPKVMG